MKTHFIFLPFLFTICFNCFTQETEITNDSLKIRMNNSLRNVFFVGDKFVTKSKFEDIIRTNQKAYSYYRTGNNQFILSNFLGIPGGIAVGYIIGSLIVSAKPIWAIGGVGVALIIINIPVKKSMKYNLQKGIDIYNAGLNNQTSFWDRSEIGLSIADGGVGVTLNF